MKRREIVRGSLQTVLLGLAAAGVAGQAAGSPGADREAGIRDRIWTNEEFMVRDQCSRDWWIEHHAGVFEARLARRMEQYGVQARPNAIPERFVLDGIVGSTLVAVRNDGSLAMLHPEVSFQTAVGHGSDQWPALRVVRVTVRDRVGLLSRAEYEWDAFVGVWNWITV